MSARLVLAALLGAAAAQEPGPLQKSLLDAEPKGDWHYGDLPGAFAEAKKTGKPMLVVFR